MGVFQSWAEPVRAFEKVTEFGAVGFARIGA